MTKHGDYSRGGDNMGIFTLNALITTHYSISFLLHSQFNTLNPLSTSCRASLERLTTPCFPATKPQFARKGYAPQSLIIRNPKALFKGKSERSAVICGENKLPARLWQSSLEAKTILLHQASKRGAKSQENLTNSLFMLVHALFASAISRDEAEVSAIWIRS